MDSTDVIASGIILAVMLVLSSTLLSSYLDSQNRRICRQALAEQIIKGVGALPLYSPADIEQLCK